MYLTSNIIACNYAVKYLKTKKFYTTTYSITHTIKTKLIQDNTHITLVRSMKTFLNYHTEVFDKRVL